MQVILKAIKFNHDPLSETGDAFNIRRNETEPVNVPEWRRDISVKPEDSPAAYAICETRGHTITIQAQFSSTDISNAKVLVRAVAARPRRQRSGLIGSLLRAFGLVTAVVPKHLRRVKDRKLIEQLQDGNATSRLPGSSVASILLMPGALRSAGKAPEIIVRNGTSTVQLKFSNDADGFSS